MPFRSRLVMLILPAALFAASAGQALAQSGRGQERGSRSEMGGQEDRGRGIDRHDRRQDHRELSDAVRRVERQTGGQVLSAERVPFDGRNVNRVKVVDSSGRVRVYMDDPQTPRRPGASAQDAPPRRDD